MLEVKLTHSSPMSLVIPVHLLQMRCMRSWRILYGLRSRDEIMLPTHIPY
jgi:hypothetical protein